MAKTKTEHFLLALSPEEKKLFDKRMEQTGIRNRTAFIKKMCIDGHVIIYDSERINEIGRLLRINTNNVNQIARKLNSGDTVQNCRIEEAAGELTEIRRQFGDLLGLLTDVTDDKPGKRFMQPARFSDESGRYEQPPTAEGGS